MMRTGGLAWLARLLLSAAAESQVYLSPDGGYRGVSVHIDGGLKQENCNQIITDIKEMFRSGSRLLSEATQFAGSVHFSQVVVVVPTGWTEQLCNHSLGLATGNTPARWPDLLVTPAHPVWGDQPRTLQAGCGEPGRRMEMSAAELAGPRVGASLVAQWAQYRYGVYEERGWAGDPLYPAHYLHRGQVRPTGHTNTPLTGTWRGAGNSSAGCDPTDPSQRCQFRPEGPNSGVTCSLNYLPGLSSVTGWCAAGRAGNTKHAVLCPGRSVRAMVAAHPDLAARPARQPGLPAPAPLTVEVVRRPGPKYVLVVETSARVAAVWQWVRRAVYGLLRYDLPAGARVGVVTFSAQATVTASLTVLDSAEARRRVSDSVPDTAAKLAGSSGHCAVCGVRVAMEQVLRNTETGGHLLLLTAAGPADLGPGARATLADYARYYGVRVSSVLLRQPGPAPLDTLQSYTELAGRSGGVSTAVPPGPGPATLAHLGRALLAALHQDQSSSTSLPVTLLEKPVSQDSQGRESSGEFVVDTALGSNTEFGVFVDDDENHHIKSVQFTDDQGTVFGPFTKMSSMRDDINLKTINFPVGMRPPFDEAGWLGRVWRYSVSWYQDPARLPSLVTVRSRPAPGRPALTAECWPAGDRGLYCSLTAGGGAGVAGARLELSLVRLGADGVSSVVAAGLLMADDGLGQPDLMAGDGVYSLELGPHTPQPGRYTYTVLLTDNNGTAHYPASLPAPAPCCGSRLSLPPSSHTNTARFFRRVEGALLYSAPARHSAPPPSRVTDLTAQYSDGRLELTWSGAGTGLSYRLHHADSLDRLLGGQGASRPLPPPRPGPPRLGVRLELGGLAGELHIALAAVDSGGRAGPLSNTITLELPVGPGAGQTSQAGQTGQDYTVLGAVLGAITVLTLLTVALLVCWLLRRRRPAKLRSLHGFTNKVSSGVNVVIDKSESKLDGRHLQLTQSVAAAPAPSTTSFANNITPTYWSASQLLADHEHRNKVQSHHHHHHHGHHYHQYLPVHHQAESQCDDRDSDALEDNNNDNNVSEHDQSSSTLVMLNTSLSSNNSIKKKNITQV